VTPFTCGSYVSVTSAILTLPKWAARFKL
jgi:hypothetical protein